MAGQADSLKSILFALFANSAIAVAKGVAAFITGSGAMLAEAINRVERAFRERFPTTAWLFFEPDVQD
jgi:hypothetical protein